MADEAGIDLWKLPFEDARPQRLQWLAENAGTPPMAKNPRAMKVRSRVLAQGCSSDGINGLVPHVRLSPSGCLSSSTCVCAFRRTPSSRRPARTLALHRLLLRSYLSYVEGPPSTLFCRTPRSWRPARRRRWWLATCTARLLTCARSSKRLRVAAHGSPPLLRRGQRAGMHPIRPHATRRLAGACRLPACCRRR